MSAVTDIGVVVVTHRSAETIDDCLSRLRLADGVVAIRVVDNASDDGTLAIVQRHAAGDTRVRFVANPDNPGFAVACNQGATTLLDSGHPITWFAFVNPDCLVEADSLAQLRAHARQLDSNAGGNALVGADLVGEDGVRDPAARRRDPDFSAMLRSPATANLAVPVDINRSLQQVDAVSGALMLLPRILFERVGGFDIAYRLHAEDIDLCRRVRDAGAIVAVANDVRVVHVRGVSSRSRPVFVEWHKHRGLWRWFVKFEAPHRSAPVRAAVFAMIWGRFPFAALRALVRR
ncbi:MAG: glycosyltransferase family 2 protein [Dokdonella sp.]